MVLDGKRRELGPVEADRHTHHVEAEGVEEHAVEAVDTRSPAQRHVGRAHI